jgi:hypothetical protein
VKYSTGFPRFFVLAAIAAVRGCFREVLPAGQEPVGTWVAVLSPHFFGKGQGLLRIVEGRGFPWIFQRSFI